MVNRMLSAIVGMAIIAFYLLYVQGWGTYRTVTKKYHIPGKEGVFVNNYVWHNQKIICSFGRLLPSEDSADIYIMTTVELVSDECIARYISKGKK